MTTTRLTRSSNTNVFVRIGRLPRPVQSGLKPQLFKRIVESRALLFRPTKKIQIKHITFNVRKMLSVFRLQWNIAENFHQLA